MAGNVDTYAKEHVRRELRHVPRVMDTRWKKTLTGFLFHQVNPDNKHRAFQVDVENDELDCYDEVKDFIFEPPE